MRDATSKVIAIVLLVLAGLGVLSACQGRRSADMPPEVATSDKPAVSPSGTFILVVLNQNVDGQDVQSFQILSADKTTLYTPPEQFSARDTNFFLWDTS